MTLHTLCQRCGHEVTIRSWPIGENLAFEASCQNCGVTRTGSVKQIDTLKATHKEVKP